MLVWIPVMSGVSQVVFTVSSVAFGIINHYDNYTMIPYPSDLLEYQPERGLFSIGLTISAIFTCIAIVIRYMQADHFYPRRYTKINRISFLSGFLMTVGQCTVAAYSITDNLVVHFAGASLYFLCAIIYMIIHSYISKKHVYNHTRCIANLRIVCSFIASMCPIAYLCGRLLLPKEKHRYFLPQLSEWILAVCFVTFICSFAWDFKRVHITLNNYEVIARSSVREDRETNI